MFLGQQYLFLTAFIMRVYREKLPQIKGLPIIPTQKNGLKNMDGGIQLLKSGILSSLTGEMMDHLIALALSKK